MKSIMVITHHHPGKQLRKGFILEEGSILVVNFYREESILAVAVTTLQITD